LLLFRTQVMNGVARDNPAKGRTQMKAFTIENETNNIMVHATAKDAEALESAVSFRNEAGLAKLAADWPAARLIEIWNSLPGVTPVKKFTNRNTAIRRIWAQIQNLGEPTPAATVSKAIAPTTPDVAPTASAVAPVETVASEEPTAEKTPKAPAKAREGSKTEIVLALLRREGGVTAEELMSTTGWQAHSVRGFLSGTIRKKMGLDLVSGKTGDGKRTYSLPAPAEA
jgi:hypothetical protein